MPSWANAKSGHGAEPPAYAETLLQECSIASTDAALSKNALQKEGRSKKKSVRKWPDSKRGNVNLDGWIVPQHGKKDAAEVLWSPMPHHSVFDPMMEVQPLDPTRFVSVKLVADAERNRGKVFLMWDTVTGSYVISKIMPNWWLGSSHSDFLAKHPNETELPWQDISFTKFLNCIGYPYGITLLGVYRDDKFTQVVTTYATEGDLFMWCSDPGRPSPGPEREELVRPLMTQLLQGVQQLHDLSIAHRDISLENAIVSKCGHQDMLRLFIVDFGMSSNERYNHNGPRGKRSYQAPEVHEEGPHDGFLSDVFSLGVVVYCVLVNDYPWLSTRPGGDKCFEYTRKYGFRSYAKKRVLRNTDIAVASVLSEPVMQLLEGLLSMDPKDRLTLGEVVWCSEQGYSSRRSVWDETWLQSNFQVPR
jgi:serine/threonine protein kinase